MAVELAVPWQALRDVRRLAIAVDAGDKDVVIDVLGPANPTYLRQIALAAVMLHTSRFPRIKEPCGSHAAYNRHRARGEAACPDCHAAELLYQRNRKRIQRMRPA